MSTTQETSDYWIYNNEIIIFKPRFSDFLDKYYNVISQYNKLIFSNYGSLELFIENNNDYKIRNMNIYIESRFNKPVNNLPKNVTDIFFGDSFNQLVNNLPLNITHLTFGVCFNQLVDFLPNSIIELKFGCVFNQSLNLLPTSVKK